MLELTWQDVQWEVQRLADRWADVAISGVYGIPQGGVAPALLIAQALGVSVVDKPHHDTLIVDDLIDSGRTMQPYAD